MEIKLISFSESKLVSMNEAHEVISNKIKEITGIEEGFLFCTTQKEMFSGVKEGIEKADIILVAVDVSRFISTKAALFRALGFKCRLNSKIVDLINSDACMATLNENQINAHAAIPVGGEAFITSDGLFSGFGIESGKQKLLFVPIDERRIESVIDNGMAEFIEKGIEKVVPQEEENDIPEEMEGYVQPIENFESPAEPVEPQYEEIYSSSENVQEETTEESEDEFEDVASSSYGDDNIYEPAEEVGEENTVSKNMAVLASRGVKVAFARQTENAIYTNILSEIGSYDITEFIDFSMDKSLTDDMRRKENVASNARKAMKQTNADYAVAMSEIYYAEDGTGYVFATLADVQKSSVFKIFSAEGETAEDLYRTGLESIVEKIEEISTNAKPQFVSDTATESKPESQKKEITLATKIVIWVLIVVALCTLSALIIDSVMAGSADLSLTTSEIVKDSINLLQR